MRAAAFTVAVGLLLGACDNEAASAKTHVDRAPTTPTPARAQSLDSDPERPMFKLESTAFDAGGKIPKVHTCEGEDLSVPLHWSGAPERTRSFALVLEDPDAPDPAAPKRVWVHWVLYDIPHTNTALPRAVSPLPAGTLQGTNDWNQTGYRGPCPPIGRHRYVHRLYALDTVLPDLKQPDKSTLLRAIEGHVIATAELLGTYQKGD